MMLAIPKSVKIGWRTYDVEFVSPDTLENQTNAGRMNHWKHKIYIDETLRRDEQVKVFLHEVVHGIFYHAGREEHENECLVDSIANGLMGILLDNEFSEEAEEE